MLMNIRFHWDMRPLVGVLYEKIGWFSLSASKIISLDGQVGILHVLDDKPPLKFIHFVSIRKR